MPGDTISGFVLLAGLVAGFETECIYHLFWTSFSGSFLAYLSSGFYFRRCYHFYAVDAPSCDELFIGVRCCEKFCPQLFWFLGCVWGTSQHMLYMNQGRKRGYSVLSYLVTTLPKDIRGSWEWLLAKTSLLGVALMSAKCHSVIWLQHSVSWNFWGQSCPRVAGTPKPAQRPNLAT